MISSSGSFNQKQITVAEQANKATLALHERLNDFRNINLRSVGFPQSTKHRAGAS